MDMTKEYEGHCMEYVNDAITAFGGDILWFEMPWHNVLIGPNNERWSYHAAPLINGLVYDPWYPKLMLEPVEFAKRAFGSSVVMTKFSVGGPEDGEIISLTP